MTLELVTIPCLKDNYAYLLHDAARAETTLIDAPEAGPILAELKTRGWHLDQILLTHHHWDHIDGVAEIVEATSAEILGAKADSHRLPPLSRELVEADQIKVGTEVAYVIDVPGHTIGHIAFYLPVSGLCFTADSLMAAGCGRLFEGTPQQMFDSLAKLQQLPPSTLICSGHEYTTANLAFAVTIDPDNAALQARVRAVARERAGDRPTVPVALSEELATNPFLRAQDPYIRQRLGMVDASDAQVFTEIRARKDKF
ncbi:hydroxyacylglutathione hydrolase [Cypionkella sinensis]|uniref:Hydroxyacylglutathione hydrolase n=1 Tax=Cypionkella sinensis TaxID=1756043 RepID=A0ABV7J143_9RHOB